MKIKIRIFLCLIWSASALGCMADSGDDFMKLQQELLIEGVLDRSPKDEFEQSKKSGELVFYGVGSSTYGVTFYGLSEEEVARWIKDAGIDFKIEFIDDPSPAFVTEAYWEAVVEFATKYNQLLLSYLRGSSKEE